LSSSLTASMAEVTASTKESREEVEWIVMMLPTTLLMLFQTFVAILVIYATSFTIGESFISFCDLDKFLVCRFIAP
jgi:hypothetical protein